MTTPAKPAVTFFACGRGRGGDPCASPKCGTLTRVVCDYPLRGPKAGQTCDRPICPSHTTKIDGLDLCGPHAALWAELHPEGTP